MPIHRKRFHAEYLRMAREMGILDRRLPCTTVPLAVSGLPQRLRVWVEYAQDILGKPDTGRHPYLDWPTLLPHARLQARFARDRIPATASWTRASYLYATASIRRLLEVDA